MGNPRIAVTAAAAAVLLVPALAACTPTTTATQDPQAARSAGSAPATVDPGPAAAVRALSGTVSAAVSSAATRAASVAATAARSTAARSAARTRTSSHSVPAPSTRPATHAPAPVTTRAPVAPPAPVVTGDPGLESEIFSMINQERADNGLPALQLSGALTTSARRHSAAMAGAQQLSHQLPGEAGLTQREAAAGFHGSAWAENVGETPQGAGGAAGLQDLLYSDPPHRANILSTSMRAVGVGIVIDSRGQLWLTEDFGG